MENLAHSASFHAVENNAPSNPGIKHLKASYSATFRYHDLIFRSDDLHRGSLTLLWHYDLLRFWRHNIAVLKDDPVAET